MYNVKRAQNLQLATLSFFILGNLAVSSAIAVFNLPVNIITNILISQYLFVGGAILVYANLTHASLDKFYIRKISLVDGLLCVVIGLSIMPLLSLINIISQFFVSNQIQDAMMDAAKLPYPVTLFLMAVTPAILEELLTRAAIIHNFGRQKVFVTCIMSGIFFGFIHMNINQFLYALVMGIIMAYMVQITGSIFSSMIVHFTLNGTSVTLLYLVNAFVNAFDDTGLLSDQLLSPKTPTQTELIYSALVFVFITLFFAPIAYLAFRQLLARHGKPFLKGLTMLSENFMTMPATVMAADQDYKGHEEEPMPEKEQLISLKFIVTSILFIGFALLTELALRGA